MKLFDLSNQTALITGSSMGIGYALAQGLSEAGAKVILNARDTSRLNTAAQRLSDTGARVDTLPFDVTDALAVQTAINAYEANNGPITLLINNAGMQHRAPLEDFPIDAFDTLMRTNVNSAFYVAQTVAKHMIRRKGGKIVNIASVQSALARPGIAPYTATKGAIANLTKGMATDWAKYGLNCNAIAPGYFDTPLNAALVQDPAFSEWLEKRTPAGRWGKVEELVGACVFLCSDGASFVNGQTLYVDGGITASL